MSKSRNHKNGIGRHRPLILTVALNPKMIKIGYSSDGKLRPRGGKYFRPYYSSIRNEVISRDLIKGKRTIRAIERKARKDEARSYMRNGIDDN